MFKKKDKLLGVFNCLWVLRELHPPLSASVKSAELQSPAQSVTQISAIINAAEIKWKRAKDSPMGTKKWLS